MAKIYTKNTWVDEVLAGDERYNIAQDDGTPIESTVQIALATDVAQAGTAVDAAKMNNIEEGIDGLDTLVSGHTTDITALKTVALNIILGDGASAVTTGVKGFVEIPYACTITAVRLVGDAVGSIVIDIWKDSYANFPPTVADTITAAAKPTLASAQKEEDGTLTGWTKTLAAGDWLAFNVDCGQHRQAGHVEPDAGEAVMTISVGNTSKQKRRLDHSLVAHLGAHLRSRFEHSGGWNI